MDTASTGTLTELLGELAAKVGPQPEPKCAACDDSGWRYNHDTCKVEGRCHCQTAEIILNNWKLAEKRKLIEVMLSSKVDLTKTVKKPWYDKLPSSGGVWLSGPADAGKTHACGWLIAERIRTTVVQFEWCVLKVRQVFAAWSGQYADEADERMRAREVMEKLKRCSVIMLDDIDKTGRITQAREEHLFELFDSLYGRGATLLVPSNIDLTAFCGRMDNEELFIKRDGLGPAQRRLKDLCKEIHV